MSEGEGKKRPSCIVVFGGGFLALCVVAAIVGALLMDEKPNGAPTAQSPPAQQPPPHPVEPIESPIDSVLKLPTLSAAIADTRPLMGDSHNEMNVGASLLAIWSLRFMSWGQLQKLPTTKIGLVNKDPTMELGKRLCGRGAILEIQADRTEHGVGYIGGMFMGSGYDIVRFYAVGSTGELVADRRATFCGVFTGRQSYANTGGGVTIAPFVVGMFKLPQNKNR